MPNEVKIRTIIRETLESLLESKRYFHGRSSSSPYYGNSIYLTDSFGYASIYSDGEIIYEFEIKFPENLLFSIKNPSHQGKLRKVIGEEAVDMILSQSTDEMDWATTSYIQNKEFDNYDDLLSSLGFKGLKLQERQGVESILVFDQNEVKLVKKIKIGAKEKKDIADYHKSRNVGFLPEENLKETKFEKQEKYIQTAKSVFNKIKNNIDKISFELVSGEMVKTSIGEKPVFYGIKFNLKQLFPEFDIWLYFLHGLNLKKSTKAAYDNKNNKFVFFVFDRLSFLPGEENSEKKTGYDLNAYIGLLKTRFDSWVGLETFSHEFVHYLDFINYKHSNITSGLDLEDYYNNYAEVNAFYYEAMVKISKDIGKIKKKNFSGFEEFKKYAFAEYFNVDFLSYLNKDNMRRVINRLYDYWAERMELKVGLVESEVLKMEETKFLEEFYQNLIKRVPSLKYYHKIIDPSRSILHLRFWDDKGNHQKFIDGSIIYFDLSVISKFELFFKDDEWNFYFENRAVVHPIFKNVFIGLEPGDDDMYDYQQKVNVLYKQAGKVSSNNSINGPITETTNIESIINEINMITFQFEEELQEEFGVDFLNEQKIRSIIRETLEAISAKEKMINLFLSNGFTQEEVNRLESEDFFEGLKESSGKLLVYRKLSIKKHYWETFKEDAVQNHLHPGIYWSLNNYMEILPYGHDEYDNTESNVDVIQFTGFIDIEKDINWTATKQLYHYDDTSMLAEQEIALKRVQIIEMENQDLGEKVKLNYNIDINYKLNESRI